MDETIAPLNKPKPRSFTAFLLLAGLALLLALFALWQVHETDVRAKVRLRQLHQLLNQQQRALSDTEQSLNQLSQQTNNQAEDWVLDETLYLLKLAQYNLVFLNDTELATNLLKTANQNLVDLNDAALLPARQTVTNALTQLSNTPNVDITSLLLQLNAISVEIEQLPFAPNRLPKPVETPIQSATPQTWWQQLTQNLKKVVIIHRLQRPIMPMLSPEQRGFLIDNIQYQLSQAQWAVLHHKQPLYKASLNQAIHWIRDYFLLDNTVTENTLQTLQQLVKTNVQPVSPDISSAITALQQVMGARTEHHGLAAPVKLNTNPLPKTVAS